MVMSAGFGEDQRGSGKERERALLRAVEGSDVIIAGPNAEGFIDTRRGMWLSFSPSVNQEFLRGATVWNGPDSDLKQNVQGDIAVVSQSGGLGFAVFGRGVERGIGFSHIISLGNELDLDVLDCAEYLLTLPEVKVVAMYVEGFRRPERLRMIAAAARAAGKFLVVGKAGESKSGGEAAVSHTGHLAGASAVNLAALRRFGIVPVFDQDEMLDVCAVLSMCPPLTGDRLGVASLSGGSAVWAADACERFGFELPEMTGETRERLLADLPEFANARNPIDLTGASNTTLVNILGIVTDGSQVDGAMAIASLSLKLMGEKLLPLPQVVEKSGKPVVIYSYTTPHPEAIRAFRERSIPIFESSTRAARALAALRFASQTAMFDGDMALPGQGHRRVLTEQETTELLRQQGLPTTAQALATSADEAARIAAGIAGPVAMKLQAPSIPHKAKIGGVVLDVSGEAAVRASYDLLVERAQGHGDLEGVLVQEMVPAGVEMIVGIDNTSGFGPVVLVGFGGSNAEAMADTTLRLAPLSHEDVHQMLGELRHGALLTEPIGGVPVLAVEQFVDLVVRLSDYAAAQSHRIVELDINPVVLSGETIRIVDSVMVVDAGE
jgi:acyl-CoA synthetase (NDP forming)